MTTDQSLSIALVTPSYKPDFERCKLLTESVEYCLQGDVIHYLVIDRKDLHLFRQLTSSKVRLLVTEEILPPWIFRLPGLNKWWVSLRTLPIRSWIIQQIIKLSIFDAITEDVAIFCDSDIAFIRPFDINSLLAKNKELGLLRVDYFDRVSLDWLKNSKELLNIGDKEIPAVTYVSNMIGWHRENVLKMRDHIEEVNEMNWVQAICQYRTISEYMLYGVFVEHILGFEVANHFISNKELIKPSWGLVLDKESIDNFFGSFEESHIGVMIHSKDNVPISLYRNKVKLFW